MQMEVFLGPRANPVVPAEQMYIGVYRDWSYAEVPEGPGKKEIFLGLDNMQSGIE